MIFINFPFAFRDFLTANYRPTASKSDSRRSRPGVLMKARICVIAVVLTSLAQAEPIPVKQTIGNVRGFLNLRSQSGTLLGYGEYSQVVVGERVTARQALHFRDGSI